MEPPVEADLGQERPCHLGVRVVAMGPQEFGQSLDVREPIPHQTANAVPGRVASGKEAGKAQGGR